MATSNIPNTQEELFQKLQKTVNYRSFLNVYVKEKGFKLSDLARASGYARGFPGDVISGKRRLTATSSFAFEKALKLPKSGKKFFRLLVAQEESDVYPNIDRSQIQNELSKLREAKWLPNRRNVSEITTPKLKNILADSTAMAVFSATGSPTTGATREEIEMRTRVYGRTLDRNLESLITVDLLKKDNNRYFSKDTHIFLETHEQSELLINLIQKSCRLAADRVSQAAAGPDMFFASSLCIRESDLPALKKELRELILKFVDNSMNPSGDRIVRLLTALHI